MFDGNFRPRRTVNLSGKQRGSRSKTSLLETARQQREKRKLQQLQNSSCVLIQKVFRGWSCRKTMGTSILPSRDGNEMAVLSLRLSDHLIKFFDRRDMLKCLLRVDVAALSSVAAERVMRQALWFLCPPVQVSTQINQNESDQNSNLQLANIINCSTTKVRQPPSILFFKIREWTHYDHQCTISSILISVAEKISQSSPLLGLALYTHRPLVSYADPITLLSSISNCLEENPDTNTLTAEESMITGNELSLLQNALQILSFQTSTMQNNHDSLIILTKILHYVLIKRPELAVLAGSAACGLSLNQLSMSPMEIEDNVSSDEESTDDLHPTSGTSTAPAHSTQSQYLTIHKLNKLLQAKIINRRQQIEVTEQLDDLAMKLGTTPLLANLFTTHELYPDILGLILSEGCTTLNPSHASPLLSHLSFKPHITDQLLMHKSNIRSAIAYCNILCHTLLVIDDEEFSRTLPDKQTVVLWLKDILYELYWTKPVLASQLPSQEERFTFMIAATKLYNSLHERYSRLIHSQPFAQDADWHFPKLYIKSETNNDLVASLQTNDHDNDNDQEQDLNDLANSFKDAKMARLLASLPQSLPFDRRVQLFTALLKMDKSQIRNSDRHEITSFMDLEDRNNNTVITIRRDRMYDDAYQGFGQITGRNLRKKVQITFVNEYGAEEPGIDGGGVFKEFLDDLIRDAFEPSRNLFDITPLQTLTVGTGHLEQYEFLGRVLGKAVYESILVEPQFCLPFLNNLLGKQNSLDDIKNVDPEFYTNLMKIKYMDDNQLRSLSLTFEYNLQNTNPNSDTSSHNSTQTIELVPNGSSIPVTKSNVIRFIHLLAHHKINLQSHQQTRAFLRGFRDLIPQHWLRIFSASELQKLISGDDTIKGIDIPSLKNAMQYSGGYHPSQAIIGMFWEVIEEMTPAQQRQFLKFMTSCSRQPLLGFAALNPLPCIQQVRLGTEEQNVLMNKSRNAEERYHVIKGVKLPTSSTCMNLLKLPNYGAKDVLKEKLLYAIQAGAGFELS